MFRTSRIMFRNAYYYSSLAVQNLLLVIILLLSYLESSKWTLKILFRNTGFIVLLFLCVGMSILSVLATIYVRYVFKGAKNASKSLGMRAMTISDDYNNGFREFLLSIILPMISTYSIVDSPVMSFTMIILLQLLVYFFFVNSSDMLPNLTLTISGYSVLDCIIKVTTQKM